MAAGCPISQCDDGRWGNGEPMVYPEAMKWKDFDELEKSLADIDSKVLNRQRQLSYDYYEKIYGFEEFRRKLKKAVGL
jgi:hypothetical protein